MGGAADGPSAQQAALSTGGLRNHRAVHLAEQSKLSPYARLQGHWWHPPASSRGLLLSRGPGDTQRADTCSDSHASLHSNVDITLEHTVFTPHRCQLLLSVLYTRAQKCEGDGANTLRATSERVPSLTMTGVTFCSRCVQLVATKEGICLQTRECVSLRLGEDLLMNDRSHLHLHTELCLHWIPLTHLSASYL